MPKSLNPLAPACLGLALAAGLCAAAPARAQTVVQELTVTGRYRVGPDVRSLSGPVSYADLDLTTESGRQMLRERVRLTAHDLCRRLGEAGMGATPAAPSCEQDAIASAREQMRVAMDTAGAPAYAAAPRTEPYVAAVGTSAAAETATAAESFGQPASVTVETVANAPVPDTVENRERYGGPMSNGGRRTAPAGN